jgi:hypothetical protein
MTVHKRASDRCTREKVRCPGRPSAWQREERARFWQAVALGRSSEEAALDAGVSAPLVQPKGFTPIPGQFSVAINIQPSPTTDLWLNNLQLPQCPD